MLLSNNAATIDTPLRGRMITAENTDPERRRR
jgi:hypothetical protein